VTQKYPVTEAKGGNTAFNPNADGVAPTVTEYDVLDRVVKTTIPDGTFTTIRYGFGADRAGTTQFETEVRDANVNASLKGAIKTTYRDVRDLITSVKELNKSGSETIWTSYTYDPLKQIVEVKDHQGNLTKVSYDNFGRRTGIDNPDTGLTEFGYDLASNLTSKATANLKAVSQALTYDYDFTRLKTVSFPVNTGNSISYTYGAPGAANNTAGRITRVVSHTTATSQGNLQDSEERQYGKLGEVTYEKKTVVTFSDPLHPSVFETRYKFDTFGRMLRITYPDGEVLTNVYDSGGNLQSAEGVKGVSNTSSGVYRYPYLHGLYYDKFEQRVLMEQGNGVKTAYAYDAKTRRLNNLTAGKSGGTLFQNLAYGYDNVGNVLSLKNIVDLPHANTYGGPGYQRYEYDDLYRLTKAQGVFPYNKTGANPDASSCDGVENSHCRVYALEMVYDTIHNIQTKNQLDTRYPPGNATGVVQKKTSYNWTYDYNPSGPSSVRPHAPNHIGQLSYQYDANGNQLGWTHDQNGTRRTIVWDEENRIQSLFDNGHEKTYKYDDQGTRTIKRGPQGETVYVNQFYTQRPGATGTKHVYAGTSRIASKLLRQDVPGANPAGKTPYEKDLYFYHPDHLGSSSYVTDLNARIYEHLEYFPFGEGWIEENSNVQRTPYLFTAKELDEETGLYYFGARYYDPRTSVWQSADPILEKYLPSGDRDSNLPGLGGVRNSRNLSLYVYAHQNPVKLKDPDGNSTWINHNGDVQRVLNDNDLGVYQSLPPNMAGPPQKVGDTHFWDSFTDGRGNAMGHVNLGKDVTAQVFQMADKAKGMSLPQVMLKSQAGGSLDIKATMPGVNSQKKSVEGFLFQGKYITLRDAGNILYGINTANKGLSLSTAMKAAGGYQQGGLVGAVTGGVFGKEHGQAPYYGEDDITGTRIDFGHKLGSPPPTPQISDIVAP